ncbi:hypothetical protein VTN77DRAFT_6056 [Rasamsonia byssochlamydoides]|uniref:uncharacterized protein n=1 Tax=Rasamsonia byssochlamydoides TaxID=89139 RepID=UPI0037441507
MADAICGPSNALQSFQKHTSVDRTLQQDRLVTRQSPAQGFRSPNPNAGVLDAEFEAFETNFAGQPASELERVGPYAAPSHSHQPIFPTAGADWAADFQRLHLSGPSHESPQHQFRPGAQAAPGGWQDEFLRQQQQQQRTSLQQSSPMPTFQSSFRPNYQMSGGIMQPLPTHQDTSQAHNQLKTETFDESAFEAAFEQARAELERQENAAVAQQDVTESESQQTDTSVLPEQTEKIRIGSDLILHDNKSDAQQRRDDADELAKTAGQLLDSVSHDQSQKFRDSTFLALMRRIRDREVHIEGDEFREVSTLP